MTHKVGTKGQVVIEKGIRDKLGIEPGSLTLQQQVGDHVVIRFFPPPRKRSLFGILAGPEPPPFDENDWDKIREEAWRQAAAEKMANCTGGGSDDD